MGAGPYLGFGDDPGGEAELRGGGGHAGGLPGQFSEQLAGRLLACVQLPVLGLGRGERDFATLLALIETHAILHRLDRETDEHGRIVATQDDYLAVRELVADPLSDAVGTTVKETVRQTVEAIRQLATPGGVTVKQLADHPRLERSAASTNPKLGF